MSLKLTAESFLTGVRASGLVEPKVLDTTLAELKRHGRSFENATELAGELQKRGLITEWQAEKLLQGRHKGFILGRYKLMNLLGRGEMSAVYLAEHLAMQRRCAIKVLPANRVKDTSYLGRFQREARAVAALDHPNIVRAYDVDQQVEGGAEIHFLVMEFVQGTSVENLVKKNGPMNFVEAADVIRQAAEGLHHAHTAGLVHRDIKPGNLLVNGQGTVKLLDLGLARFFKEDGEESLTIKHDEKVLGTADYLAPEQAVDSHNVDQRGDIYSLGCTFYCALTGHPPFTDGTLVQRLLAHQTRQPPSIRVDRPDISESLLEIVEKMMAKRREDRYQSARELADALTVWLCEHGSEEWRRKHIQLVSLLYGVNTPVGLGTTQTSSGSATQTANGNGSRQSREQQAGPSIPALQSRPATRRTRPGDKATPRRRTAPPEGSLASRNVAHSTRRKIRESSNSNKIDIRWIWIGIVALLVTAGLTFYLSYLLFANFAGPTGTVG